MSNNIISAIESKIAHGKATEVFEGIASEVLDQIASEDESLRHIGRDLWEDYRKNPEIVDRVLIALCGWSMKSILIFAKIIPDDEGLLA